MSSPLLEAENLSHSFDYPLYHDIDLSLDVGQSVAIVGRSGSGKSTLLHTLSTFLKPDHGIVKLFGEDIYSLGIDKLEEIRRDKIGIVFQSHYLFKGMTGRENIEIASLLSEEMIDSDLLDKLEISHVIDQKISDLSGGQQQRVSIARVLSKKPKIIFADEPTGNLDAQTASLVINVFLEYLKSEEASLFLVTHDSSLAKRCSLCYEVEGEHLVQL